MKKQLKKGLLDSYFVTGLLIAVITLAILLGLSSCNKEPQKGYRINNLSGSDLTIVAPENSYTIKSPGNIFFMSSEEPKFSLSDETLKIRVYSLYTNPQITYNVDSYKFYFEVSVTGQGKAEIIINGKYYNEELPFFYGTDNVTGSYNISVNPEKEDVYTVVYHNGISIEFEKGKCNLTGGL